MYIVQYNYKLLTQEKNYLYCMIAYVAYLFYLIK
jgi:hypothetical protein